MSQVAASGAQVLTFRVADRRLALRAGDVAEVARDVRLTRVPGAPPSLAGLASFRGEVVPVVSLRSVVGAQRPGTEGGTGEGVRMILLDRSPQIGLLVDEITGLADADPAQQDGLMLVGSGDARLSSVEALLASEFDSLGVRSERRTRVRAPTTAAAPETIAEVHLLAFSLASQAYALSLGEVSEVISAPEQIVALPYTDAAMLGVLSWRGAILPVVSTRVLLGLPAEMPAAASRIVVAKVGDARVGLVVDKVSSIIRARDDAVGAVPGVLNRSAGEGQIDAMLRLPSGGLVSILTPERLFRDDSLAQILEDGRSKGEQMQAEIVRASEKLLIFTLGDERYGLPLQAVEEVVNLPDVLTRVPRAPAFLAGVMNLRGQVVPVVDQRQRFSAPARETDQRRRVIVTRLGDLLCGFAVDAVSELIEVDAGAINPIPLLAAEGGELFDRTARLEAEGGVVLVVNPQVLLDQAECDLLKAVLESGALNSA